ncbi:MAG: FMN-dependent NADH-azoreductase [Betaproteobacteria bacterium]|nr:FMN-dependent NADH-azoreductase [Betaproteobacteria bacterium]
MNILQVNSSARRAQGTTGSQSAGLAAELVARLRSVHPGGSVTVRDLATSPHPALDESALDALFTPESERSAAQAARVALDDALIAEVQAADVIVLAAPMINFGVSAQLKNWIDAISRARVTFRYTEQGVEGLLRGRTVYVVTTRGGVHRDRPSDTVVPYLRTVLGFLGMTDVRFVYAEGLAMGPEAQARGLAAARAEIAETVQDTATVGA